MSVEVDFLRAAPVYQDLNATVSWQWQVGSYDRYLGFSVQPNDYNCVRCQASDVYFSTDNSRNLFVNVTVQTENNHYLHFLAIRAPSL